jgi:hypothetical protein
VKSLASPTAFVLLTLLAGCAALGLVTPQTFNQKLANAYGVHTAVLQATTSALQSDTITTADAGQVLKIADESRALLDSAKTVAAGGDTTTAAGKLALAASILAQLQSYLASKGVH